MYITLKNGIKCNITLEGAEQLPLNKVKEFFKSFNINISDDFAEFYSEFNGGCGFPEISGIEDKSVSVEDSFYIEVYTPDELKDSNDDINDSVFFFASDGGEMKIGYDYSQNKYFWIDMICIGAESPEYLGDNKDEFLNFLIEYFSE